MQWLIALHLDWSTSSCTCFHSSSGVSFAVSDHWESGVSCNGRCKFVLNKCWDHQVESDSNNAQMEIDVDKECLEWLEEQMFE